MRAALLLSLAALVAGCLDAPPAEETIDAAPHDTDAARVDDALAFYLARDAAVSSESGGDLVLIASRGDGSHTGLLAPATPDGLETALQLAVPFELGEERATDVVSHDGGLAVAGLLGTIRVVTAEGGVPDALGLVPVVASPIIDKAVFGDDARLVVAGADELHIETEVVGDSVDLQLLGTTSSGAVFIDVLVHPVTDDPYLGVVDGTALSLRQITIEPPPPELGADMATVDDVLTVTPRRALWRHVEGSAQVFALDDEVTNLIRWYRTGFDGSDPVSATFPVDEVDEIIDILPVQMDDDQEEMVVMGVRDGDLVVIAYSDAVGVAGLQLANPGKREWVAAKAPEPPPMLTFADLAVEDAGSAYELVLVQESGDVTCLDATAAELIESCGRVSLNETSTSGRRGW